GGVSLGPESLVPPMPLFPMGGLAGWAWIRGNMMASFQNLIKANGDTLREITREAEIYLSAQLTASIAYDERAISLASLMAATIPVAFGAGITLLIDEWPLMLALACFMLAGGLSVAVLFAILAARPAGFWFAGNTPASWEDDI